MSEIRTLKAIQEELKELNIQYSRARSQSEKLNEKFTPSVLAGMSAEKRNQVSGKQQELIKSVQALADKMDMRETEKDMAKGIGNIAPVGEATLGIKIKDAFYESLTKFLGVDYRAELFRRFSDLKTGISKIGDGFKKLGSALGLGKAKDLATGIFDFLKNALILGFSVVGLVKFLEGWRTAEKWFGDNPDFGERLSSGLAKVLKSFGIIENEEKTARNINNKVTEIREFIDREIEGLKKSAPGIFGGISTGFQGLKDVIGGAQNGDPGTLLGGLKQLGDGIFQITKELVFSDSLLANIAGVVLAVKAFKAIVAIAVGVKAVAGGFMTAITAAGGMVAMVGAGGIIALAVGVGLALAGLFEAISNHDTAVKAAQDYYNKSDKTIGNRLIAELIYLDNQVVNMVDKLVGFVTFGTIKPEDMQRYNKATNQFLYDIYKAVVGWFGDTINAMTGGFFSEESVNKRKAEQEANRLARRKEFVDVDKSGTINSYDELTRAIMTRDELSSVDQTALRRSMQDAQSSGTGFNQFIQSTNNPVYNNIVSAFSTSAGASSNATIAPPTL